MSLTDKIEISDKNWIPCRHLPLLLFYWAKNWNRVKKLSTYSNQEQIQQTEPPDDPKTLIRGIESLADYAKSISLILYLWTFVLSTVRHDDD
jgi:hypothetical protein